MLSKKRASAQTKLNSLRMASTCVLITFYANVTFGKFIINTSHKWIHQPMLPAELWYCIDAKLPIIMKTL